MGYTITKNKEALSPEELKKINTYTRREFQEEEIYTFSVVLCDNDVDRDYERFTTAALEQLQTMFLGKTGIFNHNAQAENQTARIYDCKVEQIPGRKTRDGEPYCRLLAKAYLPRSEKNRDFILELESGIKKEVSVGCSVGKVTCSICGEDRKTKGCSHKKGKTYQGKLCCNVLDQPTDAYEWSFVAVPAQREAGVIKSFRRKERTMEEIIKSMREAEEEITLSPEQCKKILSRMNELEQEAECGKLYRRELQSNVVKLSGLVQPEVSAEVMNRVAAQMSMEDLKSFEKAYRQKAQELLPLAPQLSAASKKEKSGTNAQFKI